MALSWERRSKGPTTPGRRYRLGHQVSSSTHHYWVTRAPLVAEPSSTLTNRHVRLEGAHGGGHRQDSGGQPEDHLQAPGACFKVVTGPTVRRYGIARTRSGIGCVCWMAPVEYQPSERLAHQVTLGVRASTSISSWHTMGGCFFDEVETFTVSECIEQFGQDRLIQGHRR